MGIGVEGVCLLLNWFRQAVIRMAVICWWLSCGRRIEVRQGFDAGMLERLLTVLDRA